MADAMVTGRMSAAKKEAGNRVLDGLGLNASQAINQLYDFLIQERTLPFAPSEEASLDPERIQEARAFVAAIPCRNAFSSLSDEEIKDLKMGRYGLAFLESGRS